VSLNANYRLNRSAAEAGFLLSSRTNGPGIGLAVTIPLFQGGNIRRNIRATELQSTWVQLQGDFVKQQLRTALLTAYQDVQNSLERAGLESRNIQVAKENYQVALGSYELGAISALELRTSQQQLLMAQDRYLQSLLDVQLAATDISLLTGIR
jgi:outer membrane protein TolC